MAYNSIKRILHLPVAQPAVKLVHLTLLSMGLGASSEVNMDGPEAEFVKSQIANNQVVIFSKTYCPYCTMAKEAFDKLKKDYLAIELDNRDDASAIQDVLGQMTGARSVPRVFVNGTFIGGGTDVKQLYETGQLATLL